MDARRVTNQMLNTNSMLSYNNSRRNYNEMFDTTFNTKASYKSS